MAKDSGETGSRRLLRTTAPTLRLGDSPIARGAFKRILEDATPSDRPLKYTLCVTQRCNLDCGYCYVGKSDHSMPLATAKKIIDFVFQQPAAGRPIEIGFFGGEPLLEFDLVRAITDYVEGHPAAENNQVSLTVTSNGTVFGADVVDFLREHDFKVCISCDGPPAVQDAFRRTRDGGSCSATVERTLRTAVQELPGLLVNAVFHPRTLGTLPQTVEYLSGLGVRRIYLNPDFSAPWSGAEAALLPEIYRAIGKRYIQWYLDHDPHFISLIDSKIAVLVRGGYQAVERCQMGKGEMAFTADGGIYPCERLIADGASGKHCIGNVAQGIDLSRLACQSAPGEAVNAECLQCGLRSYCMNWCGCSNVFMTGYTNRVGPFLCASEKASIQIAGEVFAALEQQLGPLFLHHLSGTPQLNSNARPSAAEEQP